MFLIVRLDTNDIYEERDHDDAIERYHIVTAECLGDGIDPAGNVSMARVIEGVGLNEY